MTTRPTLTLGSKPRMFPEPSKVAKIEAALTNQVREVFKTLESNNNGNMAELPYYLRFRLEREADEGVEKKIEQLLSEALKELKTAFRYPQLIKPAIDNLGKSVIKELEKSDVEHAHKFTEVFRAVTGTRNKSPSVPLSSDDLLAHRGQIKY